MRLEKKEIYLLAALIAVGRRGVTAVSVVDAFAELTNTWSTPLVLPVSEASTILAKLERQALVTSVPALRARGIYWVVTDEGQRTFAAGKKALPNPHFLATIAAAAHEFK